MWLVKTMRFAGFDARSRQPAFRQFEEHHRFWLVDLQEHRGMDINRDEHDAGIVRPYRDGDRPPARTTPSSRVVELANLGSVL